MYDSGGKAPCKQGDVQPALQNPKISHFYVYTVDGKHFLSGVMPINQSIGRYFICWISQKRAMQVPLS